MTILQKLKNPIIWILGLIIKLSLRKLFFSNISNDDFKRLFSYTLELLPNETFINIIKLFISTFTSKPSDIFNIRVLNEAVTHSIPQEQRLEISSRLKFLFMFLILGNIFKRTLFLVKNLILLPFKLGVYSFLASLFGFRPDYLLSFFDVFKFNLPNWTYSKLLELHLSWMSWFRNTLQIKSITTEGNNSDNILPKIKNISTNIDSTVGSKPETYLYLTKTQWFYLSITTIGLLAAYFGYTGGIPFKRGFEWESNSDNDPNPGSGSNSRPRDITINRDTPKSWTSTLAENLNPFNWWTRHVDTPQILVQPQLPRDVTGSFWTAPASTDPKEVDAYLSERHTAKFVAKNYTTRPDPESWWNKLNLFNSRPEAEQGPQSRWNFFSRWWTSDNDTDFIRNEQLQRYGQLNPMDRDELRAEYQSSKNTSPIPSDPDTTRDRDRFFPKPESSSATNTETPASLIWMRDNTQASGSGSSFLYSAPGANDSTDTVTQENIRTTNTDNNVPSSAPTNINNEITNLSPDITASEFTPLNRPDSPDSSNSDSDEGPHTYPPISKPRPRGKSKIHSYFSGSSTGLAFNRGFQDDSDESDLNINKKSSFFSSRFLSSIGKDKGKDKDNFNGDWDY